MGKLSDTNLDDCFHDLLGGCGNNVPVLPPETHLADRHPRGGLAGSDVCPVSARGQDRTGNCRDMRSWQHTIEDNVVYSPVKPTETHIETIRRWLDTGAAADYERRPLTEEETALFSQTKLFLKTTWSRSSKPIAGAAMVWAGVLPS